MDTYRTSEMALVSFLRMKGHSPQSCDWDSGVCNWTFVINRQLQSLLEEYQTGNALVEPREYNRQFGLTKKEFHDSQSTTHRR